LVALILLATPRVEKAYLEEVEDEFEDPQRCTTLPTASFRIEGSLKNSLIT
jgi:hypothetical protein